MTDNELLLAITKIVKTQIEPLKKEIRDTKILIENDVLPRLQNIEACYTSTYRRYENGIDQIDALQSNVDIIEKVVTEHSDKLATHEAKLQKIS